MSRRIWKMSFLLFQPWKMLLYVVGVTGAMLFFSWLFPPESNGDAYKLIYKICGFLSILPSLFLIRNPATFASFEKLSFTLPLTEQDNSRCILLTCGMISFISPLPGLILSLRYEILFSVLAFLLFFLTFCIVWLIMYNSVGGYRLFFLKEFTWSYIPINVCLIELSSDIYGPESRKNGMITILLLPVGVIAFLLLWRSFKKKKLSMKIETKY